MNEQLIVKNFGPIKDATVDFKRVTVFIGPTGGGKSTLAKLAAILRDVKYYQQANSQSISNSYLDDYQFNGYKKINSEVSLQKGRVNKNLLFEDEGILLDFSDEKLNLHTNKLIESGELLDSAKSLLQEIRNEPVKEKRDSLFEEVDLLMARVSNTRNSTREFIETTGFSVLLNYIPSDRAFVSSIMSSWSGLMRDDIGLPNTLLNFANKYIQVRSEVDSLEMAFLQIQYFRHDNKDFVSFSNKEAALQLNETASGIQSVTPMLVLLEHLSRNTEQAQSFIIEEPELNLYPTAQQGLLNWLVEKCTKGENDLTITTHSPYILSSCNLLLEAYKVAQQRPDLEAEIAAIVPKACWLNPDEFAAYYVADGTVKPITDERTHLIGGNELDSVSGDISDSFRQLLRLKKQPA